MKTKDEPNKVTAALKVVVTGEFYDDEATEETLRYWVEQDLEDAGFEVDVELLTDHMPKPVIMDMYDNAYCPYCSTKTSIEIGACKLHLGTKYCPYCGERVLWND